MHPKTWQVALAVIVLIIAGIITWFVLNREVPETVVLPGQQAPTGAEIERISEKGTYYEIDAAYPSATPLSASAGAKADQDAVALMRLFAEGEAERFKRDNQVESLTAADAAAIPGLGSNRWYAFGMEYEVASSPETITYIYLIYEDTLGAHPNAYYRTFTFDLASGARLEISDLFEGPFLEELSERSRAILVPQIAEAYQVPIAELDRSMLDDGTEPTLANFRTFYLEGDLLVIIFPPYQVGPWALGAQEARIPRSELSTLLKARYK